MRGSPWRHVASVGNFAWVETGVAAAVVAEPVGLGVGKVDPVVWAMGVVCGGDELADEKSPEDTSDDTEAKAEEEEASVLRPGHFGLGRSIDFLLNLGVLCV